MFRTECREQPAAGADEEFADEEGKIGQRTI